MSRFVFVICRGLHAMHYVLGALLYDCHLLLSIEPKLSVPLKSWLLTFISVNLELKLVCNLCQSLKSIPMKWSAAERHVFFACRSPFGLMFL